MNEGKLHRSPTRPRLIEAEDLKLIECEHLLSPREAADRLPSRITISTAPSHTASQWVTTTLSLNDFALRMMQHEPGEKTGSAWSPMSFESGHRQSDNAIEAHLAVYDCDRGQSLQEIVDAVATLGLAAIITSSHSHGTKRLHVPRAEWERWRKANPSKNAADYLLARGYEPEVAKGASVLRENGSPKVKKRGGVEYVTLRHAPCSKFRVILFARAPWRSANYQTRQSAERVYKDGLIALAERIGLTIDRSATDLARLFFDPRHPPRAKPEAVFVDGLPADPWPATAEENSHSQNISTETSVLVTAPRPDCDMELLTDAVLSIRNDERFNDRAEWFRIIAAIHTATGGSADGFQLADRWSATWTDGVHDPSEMRRVWESLRADRNGRNVTAGTIFWHAQRDGWTPPVQHSVRNLGPHGDIWNGIRFAEWFRGRLLYVSSTRQWLQWSDPRWSALTSPEVDARAKEVSGALVNERRAAFRDDPSDMNETLMKMATRVHRSLESVRKFAEAGRSEPGMSVDSPADFDRDPMQLCVENGVLNLTDGQLTAATPEHLISKLSGTHFDPDATAPRFNQFLRDVQPNAEMRAFIQRAVGYSLTGSVDEEKIFFMYGTGANGKSVFANIVAALLGEYSVSLGTAIVAKNKHENEAERLKARLPGTRLALVNETAQGDIWDDQRVKELASRERISARLLHREAFDFMPTHKLWIRGNHLPGSLDAGHGFWRRLVPILFGEQIDESRMIPDLDRKIIAAELPGVLNWALAGCLDWQREGLELPASIRDFAQEYRAETDLVGQWLDESCVMSPAAFTSSRDAYQSYRGFCEGQGVLSGTQPRLTRMLRSRGFKAPADTSRRGHVGFAIKTRDERFED